MYDIYIDKNEIFEASFKIEGIDSNVKPKCRLVLEHSKYNILFEGTISGDKCSIPIKKLKYILESGDKGKLKLEIIADDVYFTPWESEFHAKTSKKLTVEVKSAQTNAKTVTVKPTASATIKNTVHNKIPVIKDKSQFMHELRRQFNKYNISLSNIVQNEGRIKTITGHLLKSKSYSHLNLAGDAILEIITRSLSDKNKK